MVTSDKTLLCGALRFDASRGEDEGKWWPWLWLKSGAKAILGCDVGSAAPQSLSAYTRDSVTLSTLADCLAFSLNSCAKVACCVGRQGA
jgi:hypothetical protein